MGGQFQSNSTDLFSTAAAVTRRYGSAAGFTCVYLCSTIRVNFADNLEWASEQPKTLWKKIADEVLEYYGYTLEGLVLPSITNHHCRIPSEPPHPNTPSFLRPLFLPLQPFPNFNSAHRGLILRVLRYCASSLCTLVSMSFCITTLLFFFSLFTSFGVFSCHNTPRYNVDLVIMQLIMAPKMLSQNY